MKYKISVIFLVIALLALIMGIMLGLLAALQYVIPEFIKDIIPFNKLRPFHVTTVISWIILCATGSIYFFLTQVEKLKIYSTTLPVIHLIVFLGAGVGIYISFFCILCQSIH
jgi:nitric oxide reductase subunit B